MDITKSREEFEIACRNGLINYGLAKFENGEYASESTRSMFMAFKAGRESIEVELPAKITAKDTHWTTPNKMREALVLSLRTAGIRIKGESE
ncbi:TPA: hypothetical protein ACJ75O_001459 [Yersinia enterocolitica]|nr:hypothetical protein [Yersinia enterocolitica]ELI8444825.1 hypothetical protein [Yersinia enterocolitica]HED0394261.1 hypothetical protein [Yersinia enterocolitica]